MPQPSALYLRLPNWLGDVCMSLPCLQALLDTGLPVVVCARPWAKELLSAYPLHGFIPMSGQWRRDGWAIRRYRHQAGHRRAAGILLPDSLTSALTFKLAGLPACGYRDDGRSLLLRWPLSKPDASLHAVESWFHIVRQALLRWRLDPVPLAPPATLNLQLTALQRQEGDNSLRQAALRAGDYILIAPTATGLHKGRVKVWPHFDALTRALQAQGKTVIMCPPANEHEAALANAPTARCLPPLPLGAFARLCQQAQWVVCNDSGVSHIAAAVSAQQLTLCGVTNPEDTGPWSPQALSLGRDGHWPELQDVLSALQPVPEPT